MAVLEKRGLWLDALHLLGMMSQSQIMANNVTYSCAVRACGRARQWRAALAIFDAAQPSCITNLTDEARVPGSGSLGLGPWAKVPGQGCQAGSSGVRVFGSWVPSSWSPSRRPMWVHMCQHGPIWAIQMNINSA